MMTLTTKRKTKMTKMTKMTKRKIFIPKWLIAVCLLCTAATAYPQASQPAAWGSKPTMSEDVRPAYNFRTTSTYTPIVGTTNYMSDGSGPSYGPRRINIGSDWTEDGHVWGWNVEDEGDAVGVWGGTPLGEPYILLLLALIYVLFLSRQKLWRLIFNSYHNKSGASF